MPESLLTPYKNVGNEHSPFVAWYLKKGPSDNEVKCGLEGVGVGLKD